MEIEVVYDGDDIETVGELTGLGVDGVIRAHTGQLWRAAFGGFAPGFVYLAGENESLNVARRDTPRTAVPAGSVALAGNFSAIYPGESPGGWQLIGRSNARMWDLDRDEPALVRPGDSVKYIAVDELAERSCRDDQNENESAAAGMKPDRAIEIISAGMQSLIQDLGRPGLGDLGVSASGAADTRAARQANRLVGNAAGDAVIETVLGGLEVRATADLVLARSGAQAEAGIEGANGRRSAPLRAPFRLHEGETLRVESPTAGLRCYLAVRGGIDVPEVLNSRSTDSMSGIGPAPLAAGALLPVGPADSSYIVGVPEAATLAPLVPAERVDGDAHDGKQKTPADTAVLRVTLGPRNDWFQADAIELLTGQRWIATQQSNRIGVRFELAASSAGENEESVLERSRTGELASEGAVVGALQVPPSGLPVLFLADHPVTGGYPVIAVVLPEDIPAAAQLAPGTGVRFVAVDPDTLKPAARGAGDRDALAADAAEGIHP